MQNQRQIGKFCLGYKFDLPGYVFKLGLVWTSGILNKYCAHYNERYHENRKALFGSLSLDKGCCGIIAHTGFLDRL